MSLHTKLSETGLSCCLALCILQVVDLAACEFEPGSASRVMLGRESGGMIIYDLEAQKPAAKVPLSWVAGLAPCKCTLVTLSSPKKMINTHHTALHCIVMHYCGTALHECYVPRHCIAQHCIVLRQTALHCIAGISCLESWCCMKCVHENPPSLVMLAS